MVVVAVIATAVIAIDVARRPTRTRASRAGHVTFVVILGIVTVAMRGAEIGLLLAGVAVLATLHTIVATGHERGLVEVAPGRPLLLAWVDAKTGAPQPRDAVRRQVFYEGTDGVGRIGRFIIMMLFSSTIAALGVLTDSTAVCGDARAS